MSDRTYDLAITAGAAASGPVRLEQSLGGASGTGSALTGAAKLAQAAAVELLTERGSMPFEPRRGSVLLAELRQSRRSELDAQLAFRLAAADVLDTLQARETAATPDDERLESLDLEGVVVTPGRLVFRVRLRTVAGDSRPVLLPVPTIP